jgi:hypothetical protein
VVSGSLKAFLGDPANRDISVGISYFPLAVQQKCSFGQSGCVCLPFTSVCVGSPGESCNKDDYANPSVALSLPPHPDAVIADIDTRTPAGGTPTRPAFEGAVQYVSDWSGGNPGRKAVIVLATDGDPNGCAANTPQDIAAQAAGALSGPHAIQTFVIGVGSSLTSLDLIASAGGTQKAFLVDTGGNVAQLFSDALTAIRGQAVSCDYEIPTSTSQGTIDPHQVNVFYTPNGASKGELVPTTHDGTAAGCRADGGWYYDDPVAPKTIKLCDATCQSLSGGRVSVELGCASIVR